jgi:hypothetical protein
VTANPESMTTAAGGLISQMPSDLKHSITDAPGDAAYPISSYSYLLLFKRQGVFQKLELSADLLDEYCTTDNPMRMAYTTEWYHPAFSQERMTNSS